MGNPRCQWVRHRLPLLAGDDLRGLDRRRVERHLIGCPQCRQHQVSLGQALETLRTVAATSPTPSNASSLWPALARQIRESRRPASRPSVFSFPLGFSAGWLRMNALPAVGLGLALLVTTTVSLGVRQRIVTAQTRILANEQPIERTFVSATIPPPPASAPPPRRELPAPVEASVVESTPAPRLDYNYSLEHGRPMPEREARDTKATY